MPTAAVGPVMAPQGRVARELETERLLLRQWSDADLDAYAAYFADEEMARYVGGKCERPEAWRRMAMQIGHWHLRGFGYWAVQEKAGGAFAGGVGVSFPEGWPEIELGYWLVPAAHGKGYATEAGRAARDHVFEALDLDTLVSYIHPDNEPSIRVAERLGAHREDLIELPDYGSHWTYRYAKPGSARVPPISASP